MDTPQKSPKEDLPVVLDSCHPAQRRPGLVTAVAQVQELYQLPTHTIDDLTRRSTGGYELGNAVDELYVVRFLGRDLVVVTASRRKLGDHHPDDKEADGCLDVRALRDGETLVRAG
jgi:hypothetical protein